MSWIFFAGDAVTHDCIIYGAPLHAIDSCCTENRVERPTSETAVVAEKVVLRKTAVEVMLT